MSSRDDPTAPCNMNEDDRHHEIACLLARGVLRLSDRLRSGLVVAHNQPESPPPPLDLPGSSSPCGSTG